ncbi:hypothetical protein EB796_020274 [Bugula neritina]|uniref:Uncharacterized protein n=1 Tax=Bugula neritina TaxID=10212 RepID=A0A7J7J7A4_BUGNE|nr:hypothetical protein EB796_020274 [Bugula neritina]
MYFLAYCKFPLLLIVTIENIYIFCYFSNWIVEKEICKYIVIEYTHSEQSVHCWSRWQKVSTLSLQRDEN